MSSGLQSMPFQLKSFNQVYNAKNGIAVDLDAYVDAKWRIPKHFRISKRRSTSWISLLV